MFWKILIALLILTGIALGIYFGLYKKNEKFKKGKKIAVLTISLGNRPFLKYNKKTMEAYARKCGCKLITVTNWDSQNVKTLNTSSNGKKRFMKLVIIHHYLKLYDRLIYFDDTVFVTPNAKNLFDIVPEKSIGAFKEHLVFDRKESMQHAIKHYRKFDKNPKIPTDNPLMINSGVMVLSKKHRPIFNSSRYILKSWGFSDQAFLSYRIIKDKIPVFDITNKNNYVGSQTKQKIPNDVEIFHITGGGGSESQRENLLKKLSKKYKV